MYEVGGRALGGRPITLDTLPLLQYTAEDDPDGEEKEGGGDASWRIVVLDAAPTVCAVVPITETFTIYWNFRYNCM